MVMRTPTVRARPKLTDPPATLSRYDRIPKKTSRKARTIVVYPMISPRSYPMDDMKGIVSSIITERMAPEISPKVHTIFFIVVALLTRVGGDRRAHDTASDQVSASHERVICGRKLENHPFRGSIQRLWRS